jgi:transposase InsO family protein
MRTLLTFAMLLLRCVLAIFRSRREQAVVELALRQQLTAYARVGSKPSLTPLDRAFWVALSRVWSGWKEALVIVKPDTVIRWHRKGFRLYWRRISQPGPGRPPISGEVQVLIRRLARENGWRARKIQAELEKLGFTVSLATVSRYLPKRRPDEQERQRWTAFLRNHRDVITGMDFFVVPTIRFQLLYAWFIIDHGRREVLHFNVTTHPTAQWVVQQLRESFPDAAAASYLIFDNDSIFSEKVAGWVGRFGMMPKRTAYRSPWQNGTAERWVGNARRELLDHVIVLNGHHLQRLLCEYAAYYNADRVHTQLRDSPAGREVEARASPTAQVVGLPRVGGLHHRYVWREVA